MGGTGPGVAGVTGGMRRRAVIVTLLAVPVAALAPSVAEACGGLVGENGTIELVRTTTLAAYHDGVERYVTSFEFTGEGEAVGSIVPLPDVPTDGRARRRLDAAAPHPGGGAARAGDPEAAEATAAALRRRGDHPRDRDRRPRHHRPRAAAATRSASGRSRTASSSPRTRPRCSTSTPRRSPVFMAARSTPSGPPSSASRPATARRSWPRSRPTTRGCRCASSASASTTSAGSRPTCSCSPTRSPTCSPAGRA